MDEAASQDQMKLKAKIFDPSSWHPEGLGKKYLLFKATFHRPAMALFFDPPEIVHPGEWSTPPGKYRIDVLIEALGLIASQQEAFVFFATCDDGAYMVQHWEHPFSSEWWNTGILNAFEMIHGEQGGPQFLCLCFTQEGSAVVFTRHHGFDICFYGSKDLWKDLNLALKACGKSPVIRSDE